MRHSKLALAASLSTMPAAIAALRGEGNDPASILRQIQSNFSDFRDRSENRIEGLQASIDELARGRVASELGGAPGMKPVDPGYSTPFSEYVRRGANEELLRTMNAEGFRAQVQASMSGDSSSAGGYLAPSEWDRKVHREQVFTSPMRRLANVVVTGVGAYSTVWHDGGWASGWVGETQARPATGTPVLSSLEFGHGEIYANVPISQRLLDDASFDVEAWIATEISSEFSTEESAAFISGDGDKKPFGLLQYVTGGAAAARHPGGNLTIVNSGSAADIPADKIVEFAYSLPVPYRQGASWLMSSTTAAYLSKIKSTTNDYIWREGMAVGQPATLLGYPVELDENMPAFAANALALAFGNFQRGYVINDRTAVRMLRDPFTNKPFVNFYATKRVGGGVIDPMAIRLLKVAV